MNSIVRFGWFMMIMLPLSLSFVVNQFTRHHVALKDMISIKKNEITWSKMHQRSSPLHSDRNAYFGPLPLPPCLIQSLHNQNIGLPTRIQSAAMLPIFKGDSIIVQGETGKIVKFVFNLKMGIV
jgi:superfamily II DNA/RNA helicase